MASDTPEPPPPVVAATPARQGRWGRPVLWVLLVSTVLAVIGMAAAWMWNPQANDASHGPGQERVPGKSFNAPEPSSPTPDAP